MLCDSNYVHDHSRHLKAVLSEIKENGPEENLIHSLLIELKFALVNSINHDGSPLYLKRDDKFYLMLYTIHDEAMNRFPDWPHSHYSFKWYLEIIHAPVYFYLEDDGQSIRPCEDLKLADGIIFDPEDIGLVIKAELLEKIMEFFKINRFTALELKEIFDNVDNRRLETLLSRNPKDWDEIIPEIGKSTMLYSIDVSETEEFDVFDEVFNLFRLSPYGYGKEITLSTAKDHEGGQYAAVVNFKDAVDHVLKFGLMGLSISTSGGEAYMSRALLVDKYELIEAHCDDERLRTSHESIFKL